MSRPVNPKTPVSRWQHEAWLNQHLYETISYDSALEGFIYLTQPSPVRARTVAIEKLKLAIRTRQLGTLLRKYDPRVYTLRYESEAPNLEHRFFI